uniref:Uncharacterized protein n=1 Tax=Glossina palpalis gambiensis TaxID=67801 RepID=A0A1B0AZ62_9MUSC
DFLLLFYTPVNINETRRLLQFITSLLTAHTLNKFKHITLAATTTTTTTLDNLRLTVKSLESSKGVIFSNHILLPRVVLLGCKSLPYLALAIAFFVFYSLIVVHILH